MSLLDKIIGLFSRKTAPAVLTGGQWTGTAFTDNYKRNRNPTANELMAELKGTAWTCASLNAAACASNSPHLYVSTRSDEPQPKCLTKPIHRKAEDRLRRLSYLSPYTKAAKQ